MVRQVLLVDRDAENGEARPSNALRCALLALLSKNPTVPPSRPSYLCYATVSLDLDLDPCTHISS